MRQGMNVAAGILLLVGAQAAPGGLTNGTFDTYGAQQGDAQPLHGWTASGTLDYAPFGPSAKYNGSTHINGIGFAAWRGPNYGTVDIFLNSYAVVSGPQTDSVAVSQTVAAPAGPISLAGVISAGDIPTAWANPADAPVSFIRIRDARGVIDETTLAGVGGGTPWTPVTLQGYTDGSGVTVQWGIRAVSPAWTTSWTILTTHVDELVLNPPLLEYHSAWGTLPPSQGWEVQARCLDPACPGDELGNVPCWWQGSRDFTGDGLMDNNCLLDIGCHLVPQTPGLQEHYNAPTAPPGPAGSCSFTEWIVFDDGGTAGARRLDNPDSEKGPPEFPDVVRVVGAPPFGANRFPGAPVGHPPLRLSVGSGSDLGRVLPADPGNDRNGGKIRVTSGDRLVLPPGLSAVTVLARVAFGPWALDECGVFIELRIPSAAEGRSWRFGLTAPNGMAGHPGESAIGVSNRCNPGSAPLAYPFGGLNVRKYHPETETWSGGQFYTILFTGRSDGSWTAFLDDEPDSVRNGTIGSAGIDDTVGAQAELQWGLVDQSGGSECTHGCGKTMWIESLQLLPGEFGPPDCEHDPVFDADGDHDVDRDDFTGRTSDYGFVRCVTGPAPAASAFDTLPRQCKCLDVNGDRAIDQTDFAVFQQCLTGPNAGPADPACDDG